MAKFIGYPTGRVLAVFDSPAAAALAGDAAADALQGDHPGQAAGSKVGPGTPPAAIERFHGDADADRFDATGQRHGVLARSLRTMQFSLMDQLPAMAWYEAALREGKTVVAVRTRDRATTLRIVEALKLAGGHFVNHFGRLATEEFVRWHGSEPRVPDHMKH